MVSKLTEFDLVDIGLRGRGKKLLVIIGRDLGGCGIIVTIRRLGQEKLLSSGYFISETPNGATTAQDACNVQIGTTVGVVAWLLGTYLAYILYIDGETNPRRF